MRLLIGEYICGGGLATTRLDEIPQSLWREGSAMLSAVAMDAATIPDITPVIPVDPRWNELDGLTGVELHRISRDVGWPAWWLDLALTCDYALVIAPESGPLLEAKALMDQSRATWIGCQHAALTAGICKKTFFEQLQQANIPTPKTLLATEVVSDDSVLASSHGWITKPGNGCGSQDIRWHATWESAVNDLRGQGGTQRIVQPRVPGRAASCSVLCGAMDLVALPPLWQHLSPDDFSYFGGEGPIPEAFARRAEKLALQTVQCMGAGAGGYVGVDLVLGESADGCEDYVIEANPRVTTSYVGLRQIICGNLLEMILALALGRPVTYELKARSVKFLGDGSVEHVQQ